MPNTLPNFPGIDSLNWAPPGQTNPIEVSRKSGPLIIYADADNANYQDNVWDVPRSSGAPRLNNWWDGAAPLGHQFVMRQYWTMVPGTFTHLKPATQIQKAWQYGHGVSTTDSQSITAQVGIKVGDLSAGLTDTFSHSVTINDQQTETTQYTIAPPASGTRVWLLWDLMYEFMVVKSGTNEIIPSGTYRGDVDFANDDHYSGAYLNYRWTHLTVSSGLLCPQDQVFAD